MPNYPAPSSGPYGPWWTPFIQAAQQNKQKAAHLAGAAQQDNRYDKWQNVTEVSGTNLDQVVTIGAAFQQGGVQVWTGLSNGQSGTAVQGSLAIGTLTVTKGSTAATLTHTASGTFSGGGNVIGAVDANFNDVLNPRTTYTISGTSVTLSIAALASGTSLYCASAVFSIVT